MTYEKPLTFLEANALWTASIYRLGANIAKELGLEYFYVRWTTRAIVSESHAKQYREDVLGK